MSDPIVGIDLGTSNSVVAHAEATGQVRVLADEAGYKIHPSVVSFHPSGGVVVGAPAKQRKVIDPKNTIFSVKRLIGRSYNSTEVQTAKTRMPYQIKEGANQQPIVVTRGGEFAVPEVSAIVLDHVRNVAATALQTEVSRAVVTVPASFNDAQRSATATAGSIAGLTVVRVLNEPTAAALAYGNQRNLRETIAVYDFGGGTFDITILKLEDQVYEVLGTAGDTFLGGDDLDERLVDRMVDKFLAENRIDLRTNEVSMMRLRAVAEQTKIELSRRSRAVVRVDEIAYGAKGKPLDLQIEITRDEFVSQVADIIDRTFPVCQEALSYAKLDITGINDIILVGGTTKIPYVRDQVSKFFAKAPRTDVNPEDAVAAGAALQATALERILKPKSPSRVSMPVPQQDFPADEATFSQDEPNTQTQTNIVGAEDLETNPSIEPQVPELIDDLDDGLLEETSIAAQPRAKKRQTAGYSQATKVRPAAADVRPVDRPPARGEHHDVIDEPKAPSQPVIARLTKPGVQPPPARTFDMPSVEPPSAPTAIPPPPKTAPRANMPRPPAVPAAPPQARTMMVDSPAAQQRTQVVDPPPTAPAPHQARTMMIQPPPPDTAPKMDAADSGSGFPMIPTEKGIGDIDLGIVPSSTAKGFVPPAAPFAAPPSPVIMDVTPRGLGIGTVAGFCEELIRRNSRVPTEIRKLFTTSRDKQDVVRIVVCQGESRRMMNNVVLGDLRLENLPPRPRGETSIEVTFMLDANGILQVRARDAQTGLEQRASLDVVGTMPQADVASSRERLQALRR